MLAASERSLLLDVARAAIAHGLSADCAPNLDAQTYPLALRAPRASFVTLRKQAQLRGCIGELQARDALVRGVSRNAWAAAFRDPRFTPLRAPELRQVAVSISLLSEAQALTFTSEAELLAQLRAGEDGLILCEGSHRGTFLPAVWEQLPQPRGFLRALKRKAGLAPDYWSDTLQVARYTTTCFGDGEAG